jgi:DNA-binding transcriptional MerR regulator
MAQRSSGRAGKKIFHKIGEVCEITKTEPYVLRYWESEFPFLAPEKNRAGQRIYTDEDIQTVLAIKRLLYEEGYTTAGARRKLEQERRDGGEAAPVPEQPAAPEPAATAGTAVAEPAAPSVLPRTRRPAARIPVPAAAAEPDEDGSTDLRATLRAVRDELRSLRALLDGARDE